MQVDYDSFKQLKEFVQLGENDAKNLAALAPLIEQFGPTITDEFYARLGSHPATAPTIEGRVDQLKKTHNQWMKDLVGGNYDEACFESRVKIGRVHVVKEIDPTWVEAVMSIVRTATLNELAKHITDPAELASKAASFIKVCDLDLLLINMAYADERLERLSNFTGMKRTLVENIIRITPKPQAANS